MNTARTLTLTALIALAAGGCCHTCKDDGHAHATATCQTCADHGVAGQQGLDWFKSLADRGGKWRGSMTGPDGKREEVNLNYKVISAGSAVCETLFPGSPHEMITVYHLDNGTLTATHYCAMGNQPRMSAKVCACDATSKTCAFTFRDATNMNPATDDCMGQQEYVFAGNDTLRVNWHHLGPGGAEKAGESMPAITFARVK